MVLDKRFITCYSIRIQMGGKDKEYSLIVTLAAIIIIVVLTFCESAIGNLHSNVVTRI